MSKKGFLIMPFEGSDTAPEVLREIDHLLDMLDPWGKLNDLIFEKADENYKKQFKRPELISSIIDDINDSDVIIADISTNRPNVLYELGLAHYLHKSKTILITQNKAQVPSDLQGFKFFDYTIRREREKIQIAILSIINREKPIEIKIGIAEYPELMWIYTGISKNYFGGLNIVPIKLKWNSLIDNLNRNDVDLIIGNKSLISKRNDADFSYIYHKDLFTYTSFYMICRNCSDIQSFDSITKKNNGDILKSLFNLFDQFNDGSETIVVASKETDHLNQFEDLNNRFGKNLLQNVNPYGEGSPHELYDDFIRGTGDIFIGGIPERIHLLQKSDEFKLLLDCHQIKRLLKDSVQKNGLSYKKETLKNNPLFEEEVVEKVYRGWKKIFKDLNQISRIKNPKNGDIEKIEEYLSEYNRTSEYNNSNLKLDSLIFHKEYINSNDLIKF